MELIFGCRGIPVLGKGLLAKELEQARIELFIMSESVIVAP